MEKRVARQSRLPNASEMVMCYNCTRGGNGNDKDKCAAGWTIKKKSDPRGCFLGTPIENNGKGRTSC